MWAFAASVLPLTSYFNTKTSLLQYKLLVSGPEIRLRPWHPPPHFWTGRLGSDPLLDWPAGLRPPPGLAGWCWTWPAGPGLAGRASLLELPRPTSGPRSLLDWPARFRPPPGLAGRAPTPSWTGRPVLDLAGRTWTGWPGEAPGASPPHFWIQITSFACK